MSTEPGKVTNLTYEADKDNRLVKMTWSVPLEHAQCLKQYQILLKNESYTNETITTVTSVEFANLSPCTVYNATVFSIKRKSDGQPSEETVQFGPIGESGMKQNIHSIH